MGLGCGWNGGDGNDEKRFICVIASFAICDLGGFYHLVERLVVSADLGIRLANVGEMDAVEMKRSADIGAVGGKGKSLCSED